MHSKLARLCSDHAGAAKRIGRLTAVSDKATVTAPCMNIISLAFPALAPAPHAFESSPQLDEGIKQLKEALIKVRNGSVDEAVEAAIRHLSELQ